MWTSTPAVHIRPSHPVLSILIPDLHSFPATDPASPPSETPRSARQSIPAVCVEVFCECSEEFAPPLRGRTLANIPAQ